MCAIVSDFLYKESKSKGKKCFYFIIFGGEGGRGVDEWTDEQVQTNLPH